MQGHHNPNYTPNEIRNPYTIHTVLHRSISCDINQINEDITECCVRSANLLNKSYQLNRKKARELLTFLLSDSDREKSIHDIHNVPVAYALKGYSLNTETMHNMIEDVRDKCKEKGVKILCEVSDGQWICNINHDINGDPNNKITISEQNVE